MNRFLKYRSKTTAINQINKKTERRVYRRALLYGYGKDNKNVGRLRVSTKDQSFNQQIDQLVWQSAWLSGIFSRRKCPKKATTGAGPTAGEAKWQAPMAIAESSRVNRSTGYRILHEHDGT